MCLAYIDKDGRFTLAIKYATSVLQSGSGMSAIQYGYDVWSNVDRDTLLLSPLILTNDRTLFIQSVHCVLVFSNATNALIVSVLFLTRIVSLAFFVLLIATMTCSFPP